MRQPQDFHFSLVDVHRLEVKEAFKYLSEREQRFAYHMAQATWHGTRIILHQVSPESELIFEYIMELYRSCRGDWELLAADAKVDMAVLRRFLFYAAFFLANIGNYYGKGDQKLTPFLSVEEIGKISSVSEKARQLHAKIVDPMLASRPSSLGYASDTAQTSYYLGDYPMSPSEIAYVSKIQEENSIYQENTRIEKSLINDQKVFKILQASIERDEPLMLGGSSIHGVVLMVRGDHSLELKKICSCLEEARKYVANPLQEQFLLKYQESFTTGNIEAYKESQKVWVKDIKPKVETILGFVEPYRDPFGTRSEFEGLVAVVDNEQTKKLTALVNDSSTYIRRLPWAEGTTENNGKGPFETSLFEPPDFTSLQALAYCSSIIFRGINLPNYNDIRQDFGFKGVMIANSFTSQKASSKNAASFVHSSEVDTYMKHKPHAFYLWVLFHELFGHGTGKMLAQKEPNAFNFDIHNPPLNPLTGEPVKSWYLPGETWTGVFGDIATSVDECRAECVGVYLMSDRELLATFGFSEKSDITADDLEYNMYLQLGLAGLNALRNYNLDDQKWGQAHSRAHFGMFQSLLAASDDLFKITHSPSPPTITLTMQRAQIPTHGIPAIKALLLKLHIYRCTADIAACRSFYEDLTRPSQRFLDLREIVLEIPEPSVLFVQANTFLEDGKVVVQEYDATIEGLIQSWAERDV